MNARLFLQVSQIFLSKGSGTLIPEAVIRAQGILPPEFEKLPSGFDSSRESTVVRIGGCILLQREKSRAKIPPGWMARANSRKK